MTNSNLKVRVKLSKNMKIDVIYIMQKGLKIKTKQ